MHRFSASSFLLCTLLGLAAVDGRACASAKDPTYLVILGEPETFSQEFRPMPPKSPRQIGFGVKIYTLKTPVESLRKCVEEALDKAEATGYPVLFSLDDWNFPSPSSDPELVEWTGWPEPGQTHGPLVKRRWVWWGSCILTEAPRNFESPKLRADIENRLKNGIIPPIVTRLKKWKKEGREYLFAGLVTGWETGYYTGKNLEVGKMDAKLRPTVGGQTMSEEDNVNTGYAALTARGHTADSVGRLARKKGLTESQVIHELMTDVVHDYSAFWARTCMRNGIPKERIYTHYAAAVTVPESKLPPGLVGDGRMIPIKAAVTPYSRPGVTVMDGLCDIDTVARTFRGLKQPAWGAVEMEVGDTTRTKEGSTEFLNHLTESGAKLMCLYGWWEPEGHQFAVKTTGVVESIHLWLEK